MFPLCSCCDAKHASQTKVYFLIIRIVKEREFCLPSIIDFTIFCCFCDIPIIYTQTIHHLSHSSLRDKHTTDQRDFLIQKRGQETNQNHKRTWVFDHSLLITKTTNKLTKKKVGFNDLSGIFINRTDFIDKFH